MTAALLSALVQAWILITGLGAVALLQFAGPRARRWAPALGLAGQPAWAWNALETQAWGMAVVVGAYTVVWLAGCVKELRAWADDTEGAAI